MANLNGSSCGEEEGWYKYNFKTSKYCNRKNKKEMYLIGAEEQK